MLYQIFFFWKKKDETFYTARELKNDTYVYIYENVFLTDKDLEK